MGFDRALRDPEFDGNVFIGPTACEVVRHFLFPDCQAAQRRFANARVFSDRIAVLHEGSPCIF